MRFRTVLLGHLQTRPQTKVNPSRLFRHPGFAYILETENARTVNSMYLGVVHATLTRPRLIRVPRMAFEMEGIVADQVAKGLAMSASEPGGTAPFRLPARTLLLET